MVVVGGVGVDGDDEVAAEILPSDRAIGKFNRGKGFGFGKSFRGKSGGEIKFPDDGEDVDAWIGGSAEPFDEKSFGVGLPVFPVD